MNTRFESAARDRAMYGRRDWRLFGIGAAVFAAGLIMMAVPGLTLRTFSLVVGIVLLAVGALSLAACLRHRETLERPGWVAALGVIDVALGLMFVLEPMAASAAMAWILGACIVVYGVFLLVVAFNLRAEGFGWQLMVANGVLAVICGLLFISSPSFLVFLLGVFLMLHGVTMAIYGLNAPQRTFAGRGF